MRESPAGYRSLALCAGWIGAAIGLCAAAMLVGPVAAIGVGVVVGATSLAVAARLSLARVGLLATYGAVAASPWNAVVIAHVRPGDLLLVVALGCFGVCARSSVRAIVPLWLIQLAVVIVLLVVLHQLLPTSATYLAQRTTLQSTGEALPGPQPTNLGVAARWLVSLVGVPLVIGMATRGRTAIAHRIVVAYVLGASVSGLVALTDKLGMTAISARFVIVDFTGRQAGLTVQPNHLAATSTLALPLAAWMVTRPTRAVRWCGAVGIFATLAGIYESGSRGGAVAGLLALLLSAVLLKRFRAVLPMAVPASLALALVVLLRHRDLLARLGAATRLQGSGTTTSASDHGRSLLTAQANHDFARSPFTGIGFQVALDAHDIFRQVMSAGGVVLLMSFLVFLAGVVWTAAHIAVRDQVGIALLVSVLSWLAFGSVENLLLDRYLYIPIGLVLALASAASNERTARSDLDINTENDTDTDFADDADCGVPPPERAGAVPVGVG